MDPLEMVEIGTTGVHVTRVGMGCATIGGAATGGEKTGVQHHEGVQVARHALDVGVRYFDTAPLYGYGRSESRLGDVLSTAPRQQFAISTKVCRVLHPQAADQDADLDGIPAPDFDYSRDSVLRSLEQSLQRLGLDRVDIALIHDPDDHYREAMEGAFPTLAELRSQGVVKAIGAGMNQWEMLARFAPEADFDCFLMAGRYTLLDQTGLELLSLCEEKGIGVILGGPYNSGILASDLDPKVTHWMLTQRGKREVAASEIVQRAIRIRSVCQRYGVPLKAATLQFGLGHSAVVSIVPGPKSVAEVDENLAMAGFPIPPELWEELRHEGFIPLDSPVPSGS